jgi:hypothetical protein
MAIDPNVRPTGPSVKTLGCRLCHGVFVELPAGPVEGCPSCDRYRVTGGPDHYSADACRSGGIRRHEGCLGRTHCTCDRCF